MCFWARAGGGSAVSVYPSSGKAPWNLDYNCMGRIFTENLQVSAALPSKWKHAAFLAMLCSQPVTLHTWPALPFMPEVLCLCAFTFHKTGMYHTHIPMNECLRNFEPG